MQEIQGNMDDVLSRNDLREVTIKKLSGTFDCKPCFQRTILIVFKNARTRPEEIISAIPDLTSSTQDSSTASVFSTPLNPFNVTPGLKQAAIFQKPETEGSTAPPSLNPYFLTPPPTVKTPSQAPKRKRRCIQFINYLDDDDDAHGKQKRRTSHTKFRAQPYKKNYKYSKGRKMIEFFIPFKFLYILFSL